MEVEEEAEGEEEEKVNAENKSAEQHQPVSHVYYSQFMRALDSVVETLLSKDIVRKHNLQHEAAATVQVAVSAHKTFHAEFNSGR